MDSIVNDRFIVLGYNNDDNKEAWRAWRSSLPREALRISEFPSWFGVGYDSWNCVKKNAFSTIEKAEPNVFLQKAMDHGTEFEKIAFDLFKKVQEEMEIERSWTYQPGSYHLKSRDHPESTFEIVVSPDLFMDDELVEIKCPYWGSKNPEFTIVEWAEGYFKRYPMGRESAFIQAATYAFVCKKSVFHLVYCFAQSGGLYALAVATYLLKKELGDFLMLNMREAADDLMGLKVKRQVTVLKRQTQVLMENCFVDKKFYYFDEDKELLHE